MVNWKEYGNSFLDFTEEITQKWINNGFSKEECKGWLDIGMKAEDADYCAWLQDEIEQVPGNFEDNELLREEFKKYSKSKNDVREGKKKEDVYTNQNKEELSNEEENDEETLLAKAISLSLLEVDNSKSNDFSAKEEDKKSVWQLILQLRNKGFGWREIEELVNSGIKMGEVDFVYWLRNIKKVEMLAHKDSEQLKNEYLISRWHDKEFTDEEIADWISVGLELQDSDYADLLRVKTTPEEYASYLIGGGDKMLRELRLFYQRFSGQIKNDKNSDIDNEFFYLLKQIDPELSREQFHKDKQFNKEYFERAEMIEIVQAQEYVDQVLPSPQVKANCEFLNLGTKSEANLDGRIARKCLRGSLSLKGFTNLKELACNNQKITSLELTDCINLEVLGCWDNQLTNLDLSSCSKLKWLACSENQLAELEVKACLNLETLDCWGNQLTHLDLKNQTKLTTLGCYNNQLTKLNLSAGANLVELNCSTNKFTKLELTNCCQLTALVCYNNQLTHLTLPVKLPNLERLDCYNNLLTNLDFNALHEEKLSYLILKDNNLPVQDLTCLTKFTNLKELDLDNQDLTKIQQGIYNHWTGSLAPLQNMKQLQLLRISNTDLTSEVEYLPTSIIEVHCSYSAKPTSKVKLIAKELEQSSEFILVNPLNQAYLKKQLNPEILNQIKDFDHQNLTSEQEALLKKLIPSEDWRNHYKRNGLCTNCQQLNGEGGWCQSCEVQKLQADFANWTSGNPEIDKFIQQCQLETTNEQQLLKWIPYEEFTDIQYLTEGGFGKVYKAKWTKNNWTVALKNLNNSQNITSEFLAEIINHKLADGNAYNIVVPCIGISQDPATKNYLMVMAYMKEGNLRQYLSKYSQQLKFKDKLWQLFTITQGLHAIHQANLVHQDFHSGNVLITLRGNSVISAISDLGLSRPVNSEKGDGKVYGVLPYVAPEVLNGQPYTQASDIYSLGVIAYEIFSGLSPHSERDYDTSLVLEICKGLRPNLEPVRVPQLLKDLIARCWDARPEQRPRGSELFGILADWFDASNNSIRKHTVFYHQYQALSPEIYLPIKPLLNYSVDKYISKLINTKQISELVKNLPKTKEAISQSTKIAEQIRKIEKKIEEFKNSLNSELVELVDKFVEAKKKLIKDKKNKEIKVEARKLGKQLEEKGLTEEKLDEIIRYCEELVELEQQLEQEQLQTNIEIPAKK